jgi:hypothetical protein
MVPEEWPIAAPAARRGFAPLSQARRRRLATVRRDFFLPAEERLTEQERALMSAMLQCLVDEIADELRAALPKDAGVANDDRPDIVAELTRAALLDREELIALLLRRADEEQVGSAAETVRGDRSARLLQGLVSDEDGDIAAAAMSLILARGRRRDRFGRCRVALDDLSSPEAAVLVHAVAAVLRRQIAEQVGAPQADVQLKEAAASLMSRHDMAKGTGALTRELVALLDEQKRLTSEFLLAAADEGDLGLLAEGLALRAGIPADAAHEHLFGSDLLLLIRMAGLPRDFAAHLLGNIGELLGIADVGTEIDRFDRLSDAEVGSVRAALQLDPSYRDAVTALGNGNGKRPF